MIPVENTKIESDPNKAGQLKAVGYKSLAGLIQVIKRADKNCKKYGYKMKLVITLPVEKNPGPKFQYRSKKISL